MTENCESGTVIWITGLSGAGKSTLANNLANRIRKHQIPFVKLDGDELREIFNSSNFHEQYHSRDARIALAKQYSGLCHILAEQGHNVIISTISLFKEIHEWNRKNLKNYVEIFIDVPITELEARDPKNIYRRFKNNEISNVAGLDLKVDLPTSPDLKLKFERGCSEMQQLEHVLELLQTRNLF